MQFIYTMKGLGKVHQPDHVVLKDIWLSFLPGAKIGVLGLNGAGKSTLLRIMAGEDHDFLGAVVHVARHARASGQSDNGRTPSRFVGPEEAAVDAGVLGRLPLATGCLVHEHRNLLEFD